jgi:hypothetical protein
MITLEPIALAVASAEATAFNPVEFFRGKTHGEGVLKVIFQSPQKILVDSEGSEEKGGSLLLKQTIHEPGKPQRIRYWRLRQTGPARFDGTLTDAAGPVRVDVVGNKVRIRYEAKNHLNFDQWLSQVAPGEVKNSMRVKRFGIIVGRFEEVIRKVD